MQEGKTTIQDIYEKEKPTLGDFLRDNELSPPYLNLLYGNHEILVRIDKIAKQIKKDTNDKEHLIIICVLKGAVKFTLDLVKQLHRPYILEYMQVSSYRGQLTSNNIALLKDITIDITDKNVLIVDDIIDTGHTMKLLINNLQQYKPKSLRTCALINKTSRRNVDIEVDYKGFDLPDNKYVVGYGLDYHECFRELSYIAEIDTKNYVYNL